MDAREWQIWQQFLAQADTKALFFSVVTLNYDSGSGTHPLVQKILTDPSTDLAVVKALYFRLGPRFLKQYASQDDAPEYLQDAYRLVEQLEQKVANGFYRQNAYYYDPASDFGENWLKDYADIAVQNEIPQNMTSALNGEADLVIDELWESFEDGLPFELAEKLFDD